MNKKGVSIFAGILGSLGAVAIIGKKTQNQRNSEKTHAQIISKIHDSFVNQGRVEGTWLERNTVDFSQKNNTYKVYQGGVTIRRNGELEQYSLLIDATSFAILQKTKTL